MSGCPISPSPFQTSCEVVDGLRSVLLWTGVLCAVAYAVMVARPTGAGRYVQWLGGALAASFVLEPLVELLVYGTVIPRYAAYALGVTLGAGLGWQTRKSVPAEDRAKSVFDWGDYLLITMLLVAGQAALAFLHAGFARSDVAHRLAATPLTSVDGAVGRITVFVLFFLLSQVGLGCAAHALANSLRHDWAIAERSPRRRQILLAAGAAPCLLCLIPAAYYGALVGSVALRLAVLVFAWWSTRRAPRDEDADFLSWGLVRAARQILGVVARAVPRPA